MHSRALHTQRACSELVRFLNDCLYAYIDVCRVATVSRAIPGDLDLARAAYGKYFQPVRKITRLSHTPSARYHFQRPLGYMTRVLEADAVLRST